MNLKTISINYFGIICFVYTLSICKVLCGLGSPPKISATYYICANHFKEDFAESYNRSHLSEILRENCLSLIK